jgi:hypothetical protein
MDAVDFLRLARAATMYPHPAQPDFVMRDEVVANIYPGGFDRIPGCVGAAVYRIPGNPSPTSERRCAEYWAVAVYRGEVTGPSWTAGRLRMPTCGEPADPPRMAAVCWGDVAVWCEAEGGESEGGERCAA